MENAKKYGPIYHLVEEGFDQPSDAKLVEEIRKIFQEKGWAQDNIEENPSSWHTHAIRMHVPMKLSIEINYRTTYSEAHEMWEMWVLAQGDGDIINEFYRNADVWRGVDNVVSLLRAL